MINYLQNETMKMLGQQEGIKANSLEWQQIKDIISAYADGENDDFYKYVYTFMKIGGFSSLLSSIYTMGAINGKRAERAKRKKPLNNHRD